jgi:hypothetical protein
MKQLVFLLGLLAGGALAAGIAVFVRHGGHEAARTLLEFAAASGCVVLVGLALLYASGSISY